VAQIGAGSERLRVGPWRGSDDVGLISLVAGPMPPSLGLVRQACDELARRGYHEALTGALAPEERPAFEAAGFEPRDHLHLLVRPIQGEPHPHTAPVHLRRGRRRDRSRALTVDGRAFPAFWRLDKGGLLEAIAATPTARFRVAVADHRVVGYAVTGLSGDHGYLQRLAVDPDRQGLGVGRALVTDSIRWLARRNVSYEVVNTQVENHRALDLYERMGFRRQPQGLAVLGRSLLAVQTIR
jgi:ribosomal protein S18 acetylase RimI-like enzyme